MGKLGSVSVLALELVLQLRQVEYPFCYMLRTNQKCFGVLDFLDFGICAPIQSVILKI